MFILFNVDYVICSQSYFFRKLTCKQTKITVYKIYFLTTMQYYKWIIRNKI